MSKESLIHSIDVEQPESRSRKILVRVGLGAAGLGLAVGAGVGLSEITTNGNSTYRDTTALEQSILDVKSDTTPSTFHPESSNKTLDLQIPIIDITDRS